MEWVLGKSLPRPPARCRSRSPYRNRKVIVRVETSDSEYASDTSSDGSIFTAKKVRFKNGTKKDTDEKECKGKKSDDKKSALRKDSGRDKSDASSGEDSLCGCCKGKAEDQSNCEDEGREEGKAKSRDEKKKYSPIRNDAEVSENKKDKPKDGNQNENARLKATNQNNNNNQARAQKQKENHKSNLNQGPSLSNSSNNQSQLPQPQNRSLSSNFGNPQIGTSPSNIPNYSKFLSNQLHSTMGRVIAAARGDVVVREDVIECPSDPRPNAFFDSKTGVLRVYHGPVYGNPYAMIVPSTMNHMPIGTFAPHAGQYDRPHLPMGFPPHQPSHNQRNSPAAKQSSPNQQDQINSSKMPGAWDEINDNSWGGNGNQDSNNIWGENSQNESGNRGGQGDTSKDNQNSGWGSGNFNSNQDSNQGGNCWGDKPNKSGKNCSSPGWQDNQYNKNSEHNGGNYKSQNNKSNNNNDGGGDNWGPPASPAPWGYINVAQSTQNSGNNNSGGCGDWNSGGNNNNNSSGGGWDGANGNPNGGGGHWDNGGGNESTKKSDGW